MTNKLWSCKNPIISIQLLAIPIKNRLILLKLLLCCELIEEESKALLKLKLFFLIIFLVVELLIIIEAMQLIFMEKILNSNQAAIQVAKNKVSKKNFSIIESIQHLSSQVLGLKTNQCQRFMLMENNIQVFIIIKEQFNEA